jgi:protein-S-isoprenylcysteine O-methyltransferase Ste14
MTMTVDLPDAIVLGAYVAMGLELALLAVPSAVSTRALLRRPELASASARIATALPIALILLLFAVPPVAALVPGVLAYLLPIPQLANPEVRWTGVALLVAGKLLAPLSLPPLRRALQQGSLARSGLFAYSRHPGLVGLFAFYLGAALIYPCAVLFAGVPFYALHMHRRALMEEALLRERFPHDYDDYARRVPRYLGVRR